MIRVNQWNKKYGEKEVFSDVAFELEKKRTLAILGESGCGKSTLLKTIAGLEDPDSGVFLLEGENAFKQAVHQRGVVYMSQEALLFPHLNVAENLGFGLKMRKEKASEIRKKVEAIAEELDISDQLEKYPAALSGGQKQRVNFGRALLTQPKVLLLDEPFASLDSNTRKKMQTLFLECAEKWELTTLFVTHELKEALLVGNHWSIMRNGRLKVFESKTDFMADEHSGAREEMHFWTSISQEKRRNEGL